MHSEDTTNDRLGQPLLFSSIIHRRPWPSRKASETEEMVKYMSSIPRYLQHGEKDHNIQEKALNVGVLDWGRLQNWTDHEKCVPKEIFHNTKSLQNPSFVISALDLSPHSSGGHTSFFTESSPHKMRSNASPNEKNQPSAKDVQPLKSRSTSDLRSLADNQQSKGRRKDSNKHLIKSKPAEIGSSPSTSKGSENCALLHRSANTISEKLIDLEKFDISAEQESCSSHLDQDEDRPKLSRRKHLEEIIARSISTFDASLFDQPGKMNSNSVERTLLPPRSSVPFSNILRDEPHEAKKLSSSERGRENPPILLPIVDLKGISGSPSKSVTDNPNENVARSSGRGKTSPKRHSIDRPRRSTSSINSISDNPDEVGGSSRGRNSPAKYMLDLGLNSSNPDVSVSRSSSRGKRSPLRQMFESPRKSSSYVNSSQPPLHESCGIVDLPTCNEKSSSDSKHFPSTRQALLKVSWKNGLPLLMFSSSDDSILVAMMNKKGNSDKNVCDCFYEIHTAMAVEVKKKNSAWLSQGVKSKKPEFTCKFVAELIVSSSEQVSFDLSHRLLITEHVLFGNELVPSNRVISTNLSSSELAAIVIESSQQKSPSSFGIRCVPQIVAILPSDVHGLSNTKGPSKLIERWESGGSCDCGGWDEGCALMILSNNLQALKNFKSVEDCGGVDGTCGYDLFSEGDARKGKQSFSMVSFKDDMFTVEFKASIHLLQAFAISIAMLHDRNSSDGLM